MATGAGDTYQLDRALAIVFYRIPAVNVFVRDCLCAAGTSCVGYGGDHEAAVVLADIRYLGCNRGKVGSGSEHVRVLVGSS